MSSLLFAAVDEGLSKAHTGAYMVVCIIVLVLGVALVVSWIFLPWLLLSRLRQMHDTIMAMRADLSATRRIVDGRLPGEAKGSASAMPGGENPFQL